MGLTSTDGGSERVNDSPATEMISGRNDLERRGEPYRTAIVLQQISARQEPQTVYGVTYWANSLGQCTRIDPRMHSCILRIFSVVRLDRKERFENISTVSPLEEPTVGVGLLVKPVSCEESATVKLRERRSSS